MPIYKFRAIEAAILDAIKPWPANATQIIPAPFPIHGKKTQLTKLARHVVDVFDRIGFRVTVTDLRNSHFYKKGEPQYFAEEYLGYFFNLLSFPPYSGDEALAVVWAADLLNLHGDHDRDALVRDIYRWCASRAKAGNDWPRFARSLAVAYQRANLQPGAKSPQENV